MDGSGPLSIGLLEAALQRMSLRHLTAAATTPLWWFAASSANHNQVTIRSQPAILRRRADVGLCRNLRPDARFAVGLPTVSVPIVDPQQPLSGGSANDCRGVKSWIRLGHDGLDGV